MIARVAAIDAVVAVRIDQLSEVLVGLHQRLHILRRVLVVHVIVGQSVTDEQRAAQLLGPCYGVHLVVALGVLLRRTHVALRVNRVIESPARRRSNSHTSLEDRPSLRHRHQRVPAAVRPAPDAYAALVDVGLLSQPQGRLHLVARLELAQPQVRALLKLGPATARAAVVHTDADVALLTEILLHDGAVAAHADAPLIEHLLRARAAILVHDDGIALVRVEVLGLNHPAVQHHTLRRRKLEQLLRAQVVGRQLLLQLVVVNERRQCLAARLAERVLRRVVKVAPDVDKVLEVRREDSAVHARLLRERLNLAVLAGHHHLLLRRPLGVRSKVGVARCLVVAVDVLHHIFVAHNLAHQLSVQVVQVQVVVAVALAGHQDVLVRHERLLHRLLLHILVHLVLDNHRAHRRQRVAHPHLQVVLMAVHGEHQHLCRVARRLQSRDVAVLLQRQLQLARLVTLDVVRQDADLRVLLARHGILVGVVARIVLELRTLRRQSLEQLHRILRHVRLVVANPYNLLRVRREHHRRVRRELLLVHPVGNAVDDGVPLAVLRHLTLRVVVEQLHQVDVIVAHEGNLRAVRREHRRLLRSVLRQRLQLVVLNAINIIGGGERVAVDALRLRLDQQPPSVRTHDVAVHACHLRAARRCSVEERAHLLARLERVRHDASSVAAYLRVRLAVGHRPHLRHCLLPEHAACDVPQLQFLSSRCVQHTQEHQRSHYHLSFHDFLYYLLFGGQR